MNLHEIEEAEYQFGPRMWDADPDVCCAYFQTGACEHTEFDDYEPTAEELAADEAEWQARLAADPVLAAESARIDRLVAARQAEMAAATAEPF